MSSYFEAGQDSITFLFPGQEENNQTIRYADLGWSPEQIRYHVAFPSFSQADFILLADLICYGDDGLPLAVLLTGFPLEEDAVVRQIGDLYGNSLKRLTGQRPVIFLLTGQTCKAVYSLLGDVQPADRPLSKQELEDLVSNYALQEVVTFQFLQQDKLAAQSFFRQETEEKETKEKIQTAIADTLARAQKIGYKKYLRHYVYSSKEDGQKLPKQLLLLSALGPQEYHNLCQQDCIAVAKTLNARSLEQIRDAYTARDLTGRSLQDPLRKRLLHWAFWYYGWNLDADILINQQIPCYLDEKLFLAADYVLRDTDGNPLLVILFDSLHLDEDRQFVAAEFYARSFKHATGCWPLVLIHGDAGPRLKMGTLTGGFERVSQILPKRFLRARIRQITVMEHIVWSRLLERTGEIPPADPQRQIEEITAQILQAYKDNFASSRFLEEQYQAVGSKTDLPEEEFWKTLLGTAQYEKQRQQDMQLLRAISADKRMALKAQRSKDESSVT